MHAEIANRKKEIAELCRRYGVTRLEIFGSGARGTDFDPETSDADFLVEFKPLNGRYSFHRYLDFVEHMEQTLGRKVDLVEPAAIRNKYLRAAIDKSRELVYDKSREQELACAP